MNRENILFLFIIVVSIGVLTAITIKLIIPYIKKCLRRRSHRRKSVTFNNYYSLVREEENAKFCSSVAEPYLRKSDVMIYYATFELPDGTEIELKSRNPFDFADLKEGDIGVLCYKDNRFISFR